jgi:uncharacterized protein
VKTSRHSAAPAGGDVVLDVHVIPRASVSALAGTRHGALLVRLSAPPVEGAANAALIALLARLLGVPRGSIAIVSGAASRRKRVRITGAASEAIAALLQGAS